MLNHICLMGRLVRDPELRRTNSGVSVANFSLACNRDYKDADVDFVDCVAWKTAAENVTKFCEKGRLIVVSGRLQMKKWEDNQGNKRSGAEIVVENFYFADSGRASKNDDAAYAPEYSAYDAYSL